MVTKTVMMTQQNVEHPHLPAQAGAGASSSITQTLLSNSPPNSPVIVSATKLREEEKRLQMVICDINVQIATFRDLLIHVGTAKDAPELREKIRRVRRQCVEACKQTNNQLMPQIKTALAEGNILDNQQLICLYMLSQLLERELVKCLRLVVAIPMDMSSFYEPKQNPNGLGNLLSQIVIGTTGTRPDFNVEEKASIEKDTRELRQIIREMGDYLPREDPEKARNGLTNCDAGRGKWTMKTTKVKRRHRFLRRNRSNNIPSSTTTLTDNNRTCMFNHVSNSFCCLCSTPNNIY